MAVRMLPLGVDMGSTRIRVVAAVVEHNRIRLAGVAVREIPAGRCTSGEIAEPAYVGAVLEDAVDELHVRQRKCICAIGGPSALLREVHLPKMTARERARSAAFEAQRFVDYPIADAVVRVAEAPARNACWSIAVAPKNAVRSRVLALKNARLKPLAMDHEAYALARALPQFDAIVDVGWDRISLHVRDEGAPATYHTVGGGEHVTREIERTLNIDAHAAEKRKRILGTAGAGEEARAALCVQIERLIEHARSERAISSVALVGNGARLPGITTQVAALSAVRCEFPVSDVLRDGAYSEDVLRSAAPDWTLGAALAAWGIRP